MATLPGFGITVPDYGGATFDGTNWSGIDTSATNPLWQQWAKDSGMAPADPPPPPPPPPGPSAEDLYWEQKRKYAEQDRINQQNMLIEVTKKFFGETGMSEFIAGMEKYVRMGYSGDALMVMLANDPAYKAAWDKRFAANATRKANGLSELLPADYIALEQGYKQLYLQYGVPATLFDSPDDFAELIGRDVSAVEVNDRLQQAARYVNYEGNAEVKKQLRDIYNMTDGEMFAYVLDPKRTGDYLQSETRRNFNRANVGGAAVTQGVTLSTDFRDEIASLYSAQNTDNSYADAAQRFAQVAGEQVNYARLGALSAVDATSGELVREQFDMAGGAEVGGKKKTLAAQERARFSGQSGLGSSALSAGRKAQ
jgi:hypothetical protein